jgi:hypothetical protein
MLANAFRAHLAEFGTFDRGDACAIAEMSNYQAVRQIVPTIDSHERP